MERVAAGIGTSFLFLDNPGAEQRASQGAEKHLRQILESECDAVPCPKCGWYQTPMQVKLRHEHLRWFHWVGFLATFAAGAFLVFVWLNGRFNGNDFPISKTTVVCAWVATGTGLAIMIGRFWIARNFDPNVIPQDSRIANGQSLAISKTDFEQLCGQEATSQK
jgi:hypothetical protein